jgi:Zn finger protein HypA/HybF involved in hydrogenase expression
MAIQTKQCRSKIDTNVEGFKEIVASSQSIREVAHRLGYKESGGIYKLLKIAFLKYAVDTSHFTGKLWNHSRFRENDERINRSAEKTQAPWSEVFCYGSPYKNIYLLRRLILAGKKQYRCENCGINEWDGRPLRLQVHHLNGDNLDNREDNLKVLCPNCHSQTDTYSCGMRENSKKNKWWQNLSRPHSPIGKRRILEVDEVGDSNSPVGSSEWRKKDRPNQRKIDRPSKEELSDLIKTFSWRELGRQFSVSDNAVRKWAKRYGIVD